MATTSDGKRLVELAAHLANYLPDIWVVDAHTLLMGFLHHETLTVGKDRCVNETAVAVERRRVSSHVLYQEAVW